MTQLALIVGSGPMVRTEVVRLLWEYIKKHDLQDERNPRMIIADEKPPWFQARTKVAVVCFATNPSAPSIPQF